ncbi:MAG: hypothetical protein QCI82_05335 [Candidatus Thermoplasmatota archaeon]|nr:hypothetical protein [Candidatus Thermoplasmatota archaeon]
MFFISIYGVGASAQVEPPPIESIREQLPTATLLKRDVKVKGEVTLDQNNSVFDLYKTSITPSMSFPPRNDYIYLNIEGNDPANGRINVIYLYDDLTPGSDSYDLWIESDSTLNVAISTKEPFENCTIYFIIYGDGEYTIEIWGPPYSSFFCFLVPLFCCFIPFMLLILAIIGLVIFLPFWSVKKKTEQRREMIRRKEKIVIPQELSDPMGYFRSSRNMMRYRSFLNIVMIVLGLIGGLIMFIGFTISITQPESLVYLPLIGIGYLMIIGSTVLMLLLLIESISQRTQVPPYERSIGVNNAWMKPFKEILPNRMVVIPPIFLLFLFLFIQIIFYLSEVSIPSLIIIEFLVIGLLSAFIIPVFSFFNVRAMDDRIEFHFGPRSLWNNMRFLGKTLMIDGIYSITPVSVNRLRDYHIGTWWVVIGGRGEYGYLTSDRTGVSIITKDGKEYVISTRDPMRLVKFVQERQSDN